MGKEINREIFGVVESNGKSYWTRIGVTFANDDGSENLVFNLGRSCNNSGPL